METLLPELAGQPAALTALISFFRSPDGGAALSALPGGEPVFLTGMGASYHAAWIAAQHLASLGLRAAAVEAVDLVYYARQLVRDRQPLVYVSQSGSSGEVGAVLAGLQDKASLVAVTNEPASALAQAAQLVLPVHAGDEKLVASKSYTNTLAALWLASRRWAGAHGTGASRFADLDAIARVADRMADILEQRASITDPLLSVFGNSGHLVFLGHGPHAATARQAAMVMSEWSKVPALSFGIGAFRHGFIETITPHTCAIVFAPAGSSQASAEQLAAELATYGARVLIIENGGLRRPGDLRQPEPLEDEFLSPLVDIMPVLLFADALATRRLAQTGFRHIGKVVTQL